MFYNHVSPLRCLFSFDIHQFSLYLQSACSLFQSARLLNLPSMLPALELIYKRTTHLNRLNLPSKYVLLPFGC
jgi:SPX domain protein involved in polyphosphate accumulation